MPKWLSVLNDEPMNDELVVLDGDAVQVNDELINEDEIDDVNTLAFLPIFNFYLQRQKLNIQPIWFGSCFILISFYDLFY